MERATLNPENSSPRSSRNMYDCITLMGLFSVGHDIFLLLLPQKDNNIIVLNMSSSKKN